MSFLRNLFGDSNDREIKKIETTVDIIEGLEPEMEVLEDEELRAKTEYFKDRLARGESLEDILPEAFAVVREVSKRVLNMRHFRVQLIGGIVLHQGRIAEMKTGEGKTLVATLPAYLNALTGKGVHIITVNDYLAERDSQWMGRIYKFLGLSVGLIVNGMDSEDRRKSYNSDITYGTNNEFGFDYLRDNMVIYKKNMVQKDLNFAIIDEVDSILVDEARTPLIISGAGEKSTDLYVKADRFALRLKADVDFEMDEKANTINLLEEGVAKAERHFNIENLAEPDSEDLETAQLPHHINQALKARFLMNRDQDYVVKDGQVIIVDEFTGRLMTGRRYSEGLHQAIEAKEGVNVRRESKTLATITFQNYFRMYGKLSGMTGTAKTEEDEFKAIYGLDVVVIPTNEEMVRKDFNDVVFLNLNGKHSAVVNEIEQRHALGQPVLVGTVTIENSELLSKLLKRKGIAHEVLNAKFHDKEAEIVAQAGRYKAVTIATNMAGRGTDILLGGNPEYMAKNEMLKQGYSSEILTHVTGKQKTDDEDIIAARKVYNRLYENFQEVAKDEHKKVKEIGGLHIIGTERHESRRIDNQLRGRAGRQGDPGSSRFYISLEDDLMRLFGSDRIQGIVERLGLEDDQAIEHKILSGQIEQAQKRVEGNNFNIRKHVLQYDDVMNTQRGVIYSQRRRVLEGDNLRDSILEMADSVIEGALDLYIGEIENPNDWNIDGLLNYLENIFLAKHYVELLEEDIASLNRDELRDMLRKAAQEAYAMRENENGEDNMREAERVILLRTVDKKWMDHIDAMDQLRQGIGLRAYGQRDPVIEYQVEGYEMFEDMVKSIQEETLNILYNIKVKVNLPRRERVARVTGTSHGKTEPNRPVVKGEKIGRNDPCPCGSGLKYKRCCGA